jgi:hypothetical protein
VLQEERLRGILESAPDVFAVENSAIIARCIVGATYEVLFRWLEESHRTRMPAADVARVVAHFNTKAVNRISAACN